MGLLDDAIREHLELKRRGGADPGEVARQEQEALGPARREAVHPAALHEDEHDAPRPHESAEHYDDAPLHESHGEPPVADQQQEADQPTQQFSLGELDEDEQEPPAASPEASHAAAAAEAEEAAPEDDEDIVPADEEPGADDVLEETPEFLQETPEHDRLWFEQKPPRDFDF
jgi:hypothetical protein